VVHQPPVFQELIGVRCNTSETANDIPGAKLSASRSIPKPRSFMRQFLFKLDLNLSVASRGQLTFAGPQAKNANDILSLAIDLQSKFLYAANLGDGTVAQYSINQTTTPTSIGSGKVNTENPANSSSEPVTIVTTQSSASVVHKLFQGYKKIPAKPRQESCFQATAENA
jgi:hypothetical protein